MNWIRLAEIRVHWGEGDLVNVVMNIRFSIKVGQYNYQLIDYGLINMEGRPTLITA